MNKQKEGKYLLTFTWMGKRWEEWYRDKSRAIARKEELANYKEADGEVPFTNFKIEFIPEDRIHLYRYNYH